LTRQDPVATSYSPNTAPALGLLHGNASRAPTVPSMTWAAVTAQVAWTLLSQGIRITPDVLRDARDHALLHLDPSTAPSEAADRSIAITHAFVRTAKRKAPVAPSADENRPIARSWRRRMLANSSQTGELVLREHFGNDRPLAVLANAGDIDRGSLEAARTELREQLREQLLSDRVPATEWDSDRLDALLARIAVFSPGPCPQMRRVLDGKEREHTRRCVVCGRARRLSNAGTLGVADLVLESPVPWPRTQGNVLAIHLHPDGRRHLAALAAEFAVPVFPVGDDLLLVDLDDADEVHRVLLLASEAGMPMREHIRAIALRGPMRWSRHGLLGPLMARGERRVRAAPWGRISGLGELPAPLPPPPSARPMWAGVAALAVMCVLVGLHGLGPARAANSALAPEFTVARGGVWTEVNLNESDLLTIVRISGGELDVVLASQTIADKAALAVGDGSYRAHIMGDGVLVASSHEPIPDLDALVAAAHRSPAALHDLQRRMQTRSPDATIAVSAPVIP
jgi:hypothetical protein